ncbi:hypothetical protein JOM56_015218 [Amanita muscaria]
MSSTNDINAVPHSNPDSRGSAQRHSPHRPGGESTTIALMAKLSGLLEPLRQFVKLNRSGFLGRM